MIKIFERYKGSRNKIFTSASVGLPMHGDNPQQDTKWLTMLVDWSAKSVRMERARTVYLDMEGWSRIAVEWTWTPGSFYGGRGYLLQVDNEQQWHKTIGAYRKALLEVLTRRVAKTRQDQRIALSNSAPHLTG